jgi:hypothetical protein
MASTVNPILTSNKDGEDTVWAFRISQAPVAVTSVTAGTGGVTVTGTATAPVINIPAAGGVTSLAVAGGGITTSGSTGAVTLTVPLGTKQYPLPSFNSAAAYIYIGQWTASNTASKLHLTIRSCADYISRVIDNQLTDLFMVTAYNAPAYLSLAASYDSTLGIGYGGGAITGGGPPNAPLSFTVVSNSPTTASVFDVYCLAAWYANTSFYTINVNSTDTWNHVGTIFGTTAPTGTQVSTCTAVAKASAWSAFPATQTVTFNPGASTLAPYSTGSPATRNYLDINAPGTIGGIPGALRILGNTGSITFAENIDVIAATAQQLTFYGGSGQSLNFDTTKNVTMQGGLVGASTTQGLVTVKMQTDNRTGLYLTAPFGGSTIGRTILDGYEIEIGSSQGGTNRYLNNSHLVTGSEWAFRTSSVSRILSGSDVTQPVILSGTGSIVSLGTPVNIAFTPNYTAAPVVQITGIGSTSTAYVYNVSNVTTTGFRVNSTTAIGGTQFYWTAFGT